MGIVYVVIALLFVKLIGEIKKFTCFSPVKFPFPFITTDAVPALILLT